MDRANIIYTSAVPGVKDSFSDIRDQELMCRRYLSGKDIVDNIVILNELHFSEKRPVFESLKTLIKGGWVNSVTIKSIGEILDLENIEELSRLAMEYETDIYVLDIELTVILALLGF